METFEFVQFCHSIALIFISFTVYRIARELEDIRIIILRSRVRGLGIQKQISSGKQRGDISTQQESDEENKGPGIAPSKPSSGQL